MRKLRYIIYLSLALVVTACNHKELCYTHRDHAHKFHIQVNADYRYDWEENYGYIDWVSNWPDHYIDYESLRPKTPTGIRVVNYNENNDSKIHNIGANGGVVTLYEGVNDILFYNNDTEYILFQREDDGNKATTRASTRTRTRATYLGSEYTKQGEETVTPPDVLFANFVESYVPEKSVEPVEVPTTLQPLVFTYKIRYEFDEGVQYIVRARGALSGMAKSVLLESGKTSADAATLLFDNCEITDYGVRAIVNSFGIPAFPNANYPARSELQNGLQLEVYLRGAANNKKVFNFDVTDQISKQPHGGVIVVKCPGITEEEGMQGSGGFDVDVNEWGDYEDVILPF